MTPTEVRLQLCRHGFVPIPVVGKRPVLDGWQKRGETSPGDVDLWATLFPDAGNTGILTRATPTLDLDIIYAAAAEAAEAKVRERFEEIGDIHVRFGKSPKRAIFFRTNEPFTKIQVPLIAPNGDTTQKIEFLGDGQQVVVHGQHPETGQPYSWYGGALCETSCEDLPYIREAEARQLVDDIVAVLEAEFGYRRAQQRAKPGKGNGGAAEPLP